MLRGIYPRSIFILLFFRGIPRFFYFFLKLTQNLSILLFSFFHTFFPHFITIHKTPVLFIQFCKHGYSHPKMWIMWITRCITPFYHVFLCTFVWKDREQNVESKVVHACSFDFLCRFTLLFFVMHEDSIFFCVCQSDNLSNCAFNLYTIFLRLFFSLHFPSPTAQNGAVTKLLPVGFSVCVFRKI